MIEAAIITITIIIITGLTSYKAFEDRILKAKFIFLPAKIKETGEWYRFFSSGLIHADWVHLFLNLYVLYAFGKIVEPTFEYYFGGLLGKFLYLLMYVSAIGVASLSDYFKHQDYYGYAALGASGAVSAVLFSSIFFSPWGNFGEFGIGIIFIPGFFIPPALFGILYLWYSSYMAKRQMDNIGHNAHFWGGVYGFVFTLLVSLFVNPALAQGFFYEFYQGLLIQNWL